MSVKKYMIHDNYARPFIVIDDDMNKIVKIFKTDETEFILETKYEKLFTGEPFLDIYHDLYTFESGNTVLIYLGGYKYMHVGMCIYSFETEEGDDNLIYDYVSPIGNNDVPYPYAISKNRIYLMAENIIIDTSSIEKQNLVMNDSIDPYCLYYDYGSKLNTRTLQYVILCERSF